MYNEQKITGKTKSLQINDTVIAEDDLPEYIKTESSNTCVTSVPQEYQLAELNITASNIWNGAASVILPPIDEFILNPSPKDLECLIFDGVIEDWIVITLVFTLMILNIFWIVRKYLEQN